LLEAIRAVECQYLHLIKHRAPELTVDLGNNDWPNIFDRRCRALPCVLNLLLAPMLKKQDCYNKNNHQA
jgi:hypothetical protein